MAFYAAERRKLIYTPDQPAIHDPTDPFLKEHAEALAMRFDRTPPPVEIDDFEYGRVEQVEIDEYLNDDRRRKKASRKKAEI